ncbi:hypothetical protein ACJJTC_006237 [Scirpophaga incertulas]
MRSLLIFIFVISAVSSRHVNFYRKDYTYIEEYDAFYKFHNDPTGVNFSSTFLACDDEGATLFYPSSANEWKVAKQLMLESPDSPNLTDIFIGMHDKFGLGEYITVDGHPVTILVEQNDNIEDHQCVTMDIETGAYTGSSCVAKATTFRPYICKKIEDVSCPTIDTGYKYMKETKKCYKINKNPKTWLKAMETCFMEGGLLVVVESDMEANVIRHLIDEDNYYAGFRKLFPDKDYYSIKGHKIQDSGYYRWYNERNTEYDCGYLMMDNNELYMNAVYCSTKLPFICEIGVP